MKIPFTKLHGARNDFLLTFQEDAPKENLPDIARCICDRYTGVGADGWMVVDLSGGRGYDASVRLFNSDGSEPEISGNGTRCAAALLAKMQPSWQDFHIRTGAGIKHLHLTQRVGREYWFRMDMGEVRVIERQATVQGHDAVILDVGNPQCAIPVDHFDFDWRALGAAIERDPRFPNRTNVSFIAPLSRSAIQVRFWERGAGETNSSGTGATGAALAAIARGLAETPVMVETPAGPLYLRCEDRVYLTGPAEFVAEGSYLYGKMAAE